MRSAGLSLRGPPCAVISAAAMHVRPPRPIRNPDSPACSCGLRYLHWTWAQAKYLRLGFCVFVAMVPDLGGGVFPRVSDRLIENTILEPLLCQVFDLFHVFLLEGIRRQIANELDFFRFKTLGCFPAIADPPWTDHWIQAHDG